MKPKDVTGAKDRGSPEIFRQAFAERPRRPFKELAALVRAMIGVRPQTPAEDLLHEAREER
jgi:hypothetical protein